MPVAGNQATAIVLTWCSCGKLLDRGRPLTVAELAAWQARHASCPPAPQAPRRGRPPARRR